MKEWGLVYDYDINGTYPWYYLMHTFRNSKPIHGSDCNTSTLPLGTLAFYT
jgi:hypothetical protein